MQARAKFGVPQDIVEILFKRGRYQTEVIQLTNDIQAARGLIREGQVYA